VDATTVAVDNKLGSRTNPIVNTAILGAFSKAAGNVGMEAIKESINENAPVKPDENMKAADDAFNKTVGA
jgi:pyruvate ferredoxin oxidoreductase gamma subunit/2-oxoisovalerate ferredoxin oxidoreductase gamma subunit